MSNLVWSFEWNKEGYRRFLLVHFDEMVDVYRGDVPIASFGDSVLQRYFEGNEELRVEYVDSILEEVGILVAQKEMFEYLERCNEHTDVWSYLEESKFPTLYFISKVLDTLMSYSLCWELYDNDDKSCVEELRKEVQASIQVA